MATKAKAAAPEALSLDRASTQTPPRVPPNSWARAAIESQGGDTLYGGVVSCKLATGFSGDGSYDTLTIEVEAEGSSGESSHSFTIDRWDDQMLGALVDALTALRVAQMVRGAK
jgi:hypothetical protein